jgi:hypothetical protein
MDRGHDPASLIADLIIMLIIAPAALLSTGNAASCPALVGSRAIRLSVARKVVYSGKGDEAHLRHARARRANRAG